MKLALFVVAGLSLFGCADDVSTSGGGGRTKISFFDPNQAKPFDPTQVVEVSQKVGTAPADSICEGCVMTAYSLVSNSYGLTEVRLVSDGRAPVCKIFLNNDGVVIDECGWSRP